MHGFEEVCCYGLRKCNDAIVITHDDVTRLDDQAANRYFHIDSTRAVLEWSAMNGSPGEAWKARFHERIKVTDRAVDDEARRAANLSYGHHDLTDQSAADLSVAIDHDHIAGLHEIQRLVYCQVVAGCNANRQRRTCHHLLYLMKRPDADRTGKSVKIVADDCCRTALKRCDNSFEPAQICGDGEGVIHGCLPIR